MADRRLEETKVRRFREAAQSLKLYRRAELQDPDKGSPLIAALYVDPLPADQVFQTVLRPNTTFVIGRKGTGKSTIFQRLQYELRQSKSQTSAYIDIKTLYESAQVEEELLAKISAADVGLPAGEVKRLLLYREFIRTVVVEIKKELRKRVQASAWESFKEKITGNLHDLFAGLDELVEDADENRYKSVLGVMRLDVQARAAKDQKSATSGTASAKIAKDPSLGLDMKAEKSSQISTGEELKYSDLLMQTFNVKEVLERLKALLEELKIRHLFVLIDDFSELPPEAMRVVVDVLLAPLNNWSDEFIKFKVAAYPGRIYYGDIDKTKIDEVYLDLYMMYGRPGVTEMEIQAIDFTKRLVNKRLQHYCGCSSADFFDSDEDEIWKQLFYATMANPRILGYLLYYLHESNLIYGRTIGVRSIRQAARRYYEEKVEFYFTEGKFLHESFDERSSIFGLKELLERIVSRARALRDHQSGVISKISGVPPTSHFHVLVPLENLLSTLELNFFVTKYFEQSDRDGRKVSVFALNYGLCQKFTIEFGRPKGEREFRLYFVERIFDYSQILRDYVARNQEIVCDNLECSATYSFEHLDALKFYNMRCKECGTGTCKVVNLSRKYEAELAAVQKELLLPKTELGILQTLHSEQRALRASEIAEELDCSYQLVGKRGKILEDRGFVDRANKDGRRIFAITDTAEIAYFSDDAREELTVDVQD
jgi:Cdc6-like AAA superfamily ATPase